MSLPDGVARAGLTAKGVVYGLLAVLALQIAMGDGAQADSQGALRALSRQPVGTGLLALLALGLIGYTVWQAVTVWQCDHWRGRITAGLRMLIWGGLAISALRMVLDAEMTDDQEQNVTAWLLDAPMGQWIVALGGLVLVGVGLAYLRHLKGDRYFKDMGAVPHGTRSWLKGVTVTGIWAKAGVYALVGAFLVRAAIRHEPESGVGLDAALSQVAQRSYGTYVLAAVSIGFAAYGVWCLARARYEDVERSDG